MKRRPLVYLCCGFAFGIWMQYYASRSWLAAAAALATVRLGAEKNTELCGRDVAVRNVMAVLISILCGSLIMGAAEAEEGVLTAEAGRVVSVTGRVESVQEKDGYCNILVFVNGRGIREKTLLVVSGEPQDHGLVSFSELPGRRVSVKGTVELPKGVRNPGCFNYRLYLRSRDVFSLIRVQKGELAPGGVERPLFRFLAGAKTFFSKKVLSSCDRETGGLILAMMFGDKSMLADDLYEGFQKNGTAHLLAVSGIHVNLVYLYIRKLLGNRRDLRPTAVAAVCLIVYAALAGFSPSVMRASLMIGISMAALLFRRDYDMCTSAAAAAGILLALRPHRIFDTGFQLSFLSVLSMAVILPWAAMKLRKVADGTKKEWISAIAEKAGPLIVIQLMMAPVTAYLFHYFSWSSFLLNPVLIPLAGVIVPIGLILFPLSFLPGQAGKLLFAFGLNGALIPAKLMILCSDFFAARDAGAFVTVSPPAGLTALFYGVVFFCCSESCYILRRKRKKRTAAFGVCLILLASCTLPVFAGAADFPWLLSRRTIRMVFVDVNQGDCLHIRTPEGRNILIDGGG